MSRLSAETTSTLLVTLNNSTPLNWPLLHGATVDPVILVIGRPSASHSSIHPVELAVRDDIRYLVSGHGRIMLSLQGLIGQRIVL